MTEAAQVEVDPADWGLVTWHCSEDGGGPDCGYSLGLGDGHILWCGEITKARHAEAGEEAAELGNDFGWWVILYQGQMSTVVAKCVNDTAAREMVDVLARAMRSPLEEINSEIAKVAAAEQPAPQVLRTIAMICGNTVGK